MDDQEARQVGNIIDDLEGELRHKNSHIGAVNDAMISNSVYSGQNENLIVFQLELDNILEKIEHLLRGDVVKVDADGNAFYGKPKDKNLIILNEYGIQLIMNTISFYLNRNTILSAYGPERIDEILYDLGDELADVILCNYKKMGMDSIQKRSRYPLLVINVIHTIESTYKRALEGGERESLRSARVVTQTDRPGMAAYPGMPMTGEKRAFKFLDPKTW